LLKKEQPEASSSIRIKIVRMVLLIYQFINRDLITMLFCMFILQLAKKF